MVMIPNLFSQIVCHRRIDSTAEDINCRTAKAIRLELSSEPKKIISGTIGASNTGRGFYLSQPARDVLVELLEATVPVARKGSSLFRPIWVHEAMHRAMLMNRLVSCNDLRAGDECFVWDVEVARQISSYFRMLATPDDRQLILGGNILSNLIGGIESLFSVCMDTSNIDLTVTDAVMPACSWRALALASCNFIFYQLLETLDDHLDLDIDISLVRDDHDIFRLRMRGRPTLMMESFDCRILPDLTDVLNGTLTGNRDIAIGTYREISFIYM